MPPGWVAGYRRLKLLCSPVVTGNGVIDGRFLPLRRRELGFRGRRRIAVNLRLTEPESVATIPIRRFEGLVSFQDLPQDGRCVRDYWF